MLKRGQLTIFIIIALLLVSIVAFYYLVFPKIKFTEEDTSSPIYEFMYECIEETAIDSAKIFGLRQGYYDIPDQSLDTGFSSIAYYYHDGEIIIPKNGFFEKEFSKILEEKILSECTDFLDFEIEGYEITSNRVSSKIEILENTMGIKVDFPVKVKDSIEGTETKFSKFNYDLPIRLGHILDVSRDLVDKIKEEPYATDLGFFLNQDVSISIDEYDSCNQVYIILDEESLPIDDNSYAYSFAVKLEEEYCVLDEI